MMEYKDVKFLNLLENAQKDFKKKYNCINLSLALQIDNVKKMVDEYNDYVGTDKDFIAQGYLNSFNDWYQYALDQKLS